MDECTRKSSRVGSPKHQKQHSSGCQAVNFLGSVLMMGLQLCSMGYWMLLYAVALSVRSPSSFQYDKKALPEVAVN